MRVRVDAATGELVAGAGEGEEEEQEGEGKQVKGKEGVERAKKQRLLPSPSSRAAALGSRVVAAARRLRAALDPLPLDA